MWIKICGLTSPDAVTAALEHAVDALGFVFAESVRRVTPAQAAQLSRRARGRAPCVAVMRHPSQALVDEVLAVFRPDVLQSDAADLATLRLPQGLALLPVLRGAPAAAGPLPPRLLFEGASSGSGRTADWGTAHALARRTHDLGFDIAALDAAGRARQTQLGGECRQALPSPLQQFLLDLHRGHERLAHGLDRHELHYVQQLDLGIHRGGQGPRLAPDGETVVGEVDDQQDAVVNRHGGPPVAVGRED